MGGGGGDIPVRIVLRLDLFSHRGKKQLGSGLLAIYFIVNYIFNLICKVSDNKNSVALLYRLFKMCRHHGIGF